jgi:hypothetical protein
LCFGTNSTTQTELKYNQEVVVDIFYNHWCFIFEFSLFLEKYYQCLVMSKYGDNDQIQNCKNSFLIATCIALIKCMPIKDEINFVKHTSDHYVPCNMEWKVHGKWCLLLALYNNIIIFLYLKNRHMYCTLFNTKVMQQHQSDEI